MNQEETHQFAQQLYADFAQGNLEAVFSKIDVNADWIIQGDPSQIPISGTFKGHDEVMGLFQKLFSVLDIQRNSPDQILVNGNAVAAIGSVEALARSTGKPHTTRFVDLMTVENGMVMRYERIFDTLNLQQAIQD